QQWSSDHEPGPNPHRDAQILRPLSSAPADLGSTSLQLDVEGPDEVTPLLRFVGDELAKVSGRKRERVATQTGKPRLVLWIGEASVVSLLSLSMISAGVAFGAPTPYQLLAS